MDVPCQCFCCVDSYHYQLNDLPIFIHTSALWSTACGLFKPSAAREIRKQIWAAFLVSWVLVSRKKLIKMVTPWSRNSWKHWPDLPLELCTRIKQWPCATSVSSNWKADVRFWDLQETHGNNIKSEKCCSLPCPFYDWCKYTCIFLPCGFLRCKLQALPQYVLQRTI